MTTTRPMRESDARVGQRFIHGQTGRLCEITHAEPGRTPVYRVVPDGDLLCHPEFWTIGNRVEIES